MEMRLTYIPPQCVLRATWVNTNVCASAWLDPLNDDEDTIEWDD
jgi:hypothetical protein